MPGDSTHISKRVSVAALDVSGQNQNDPAVGTVTQPHSRPVFAFISLSVTLCNSHTHKGTKKGNCARGTWNAALPLVRRRFLPWRGSRVEKLVKEMACSPSWYSHSPHERFLSLSLSLCLSVSLPPRSSHQVAVFVDCSPAVVIATVMQTSRTGCLSAWICQVCVCVCACDKTPECSWLREEVFWELCNVLFFKRGAKVKKKKKTSYLSVSMLLSALFLTKKGECGVLTAWRLCYFSPRVGRILYPYCLFL